MKSSELRKKSKEELEKMEYEKKRGLAELYLKLGGGQLSNTNLIKETKKDIARILTIKEPTSALHRQRGKGAKVKTVKKIIKK